MKKGLILILACLVVLAAIPTSYAAEGSEKATSLTKLGNGLVNILTGWVELPRQIYLVWKEEGPVHGLTLGIIRGVGYAIARTGAGAIDTAIFYIRPFDKPIMEPLKIF